MHNLVTVRFDLLPSILLFDYHLILLLFIMKLLISKYHNRYSHNVINLKCQNIGNIKYVDDLMNVRYFNMNDFNILMF
jgi:hypothetical protein